MLLVLGIMSMWTLCLLILDWKNNNLMEAPSFYASWWNVILYLLICPSFYTILKNSRRIWLSTGQRWIQHIIHLFAFLSGSRTYIWCNWVYNFNWYLVSWLCPCWAALRPGWCLSCRFYLSYYDKHLCPLVSILSESFYLWYCSLCFLEKMRWTSW